MVACAINEPITLKKCTNTGCITGSAKVGGIAGELRHELAVLDGCYNAADVDEGVVNGGGITGTDADESKVKNVGGLVGNTTKEGATIKHSSSITTVTVPAAVETAGHLAGSTGFTFEDCYYFAPDAMLPLDDETLAVAEAENVFGKWYEVYVGSLKALVMGQEIDLGEQPIGIVYATSDEANIELPEIVYGGFTIEEFEVAVPYATTEEGCSFTCGEYTAKAGEFDIQGTSIEGAKVGKTLTLTTTFMVGQMPMPLTVTFEGEQQTTETAVQTIEPVKAETGARYDLQGRQTNAKTGLMIENGKIRLVR